MQKMFTNKKYEQDVKKVVDTIIKKYKPEKIIAFGSTARGDASASSDIDLLIVKKTKKSFWDRVEEVIRLTPVYCSLDISVLTPNEISEAYKKNWYFITEEMIKKGRTIYERVEPS